MNTSDASPIILASSSPRRRELLSLLGRPFRVATPDVDEGVREGENARTHALRLAREKAGAVHDAPPAGSRDEPCIVIAADTVVTCDGRILGKPRDAADACSMLELLSGGEHEVITAVAIRCGTEEQAFAVATRVIMKPLTRQEILDYVATGEPMDKAGAYAAQGGAAHMVRSLHGSYTNVVGLPLVELAETLSAHFGWSD